MHVNVETQMSYIVTSERTMSPTGLCSLFSVYAEAFTQHNNTDSFDYTVHVIANIISDG